MGLCSTNAQMLHVPGKGLLSCILIVSCGRCARNMELMVSCYGPFNLCIVRVRVWFALPTASQTGFHYGLDSVKAALSPVLLTTFIHRISGCSQMAQGARFGGLRIPSMLFADDVVLYGFIKRWPSTCTGKV